MRVCVATSKQLRSRMAQSIELQWKRPNSIEYPKVWHTFKAKDVNSDNLVEYRIEDLTESKYEDALAMLVEYFCRDEPTCQAYGMIKCDVALLTKVIL